MTIPTASNFPDSYDTDENLYLVHDALRVRLAEDYEPGDTSITITGDEEVLSRFPSSGLITLTEQCSEPDKRAISFFYSSKTDTTFDGLEILPGFEDNKKLKRITNVTQNVMASHHNNLKDAIIAIEEFVGVKGTIDDQPLGDTLEGRINFLRKMILTPKAWFSVNKRTGLVPLTVSFTDQSFRLGDGTITYIWDFGDQTSSNISTIEAVSVVPTDQVNVFVQDLDGGEIQKTYTAPGIYDVKLTVINENGENSVTFKDLINARVEAPEEAQIDFIPRSSQNNTSGDESPLFDRLATKAGGPFDIPPTIRSKANTFVDMQVPEGSLTPDRSYGGEKLTAGGTPIDPITSYTWSLGDDLVHSNSNVARASYSVGGVYDLKLRVDTAYGAFRITTYENCIDIIENRNLWLFNHTTSSTVRANEFGLISETFKTATRTQSITKDDSFLDGTGDEERAKQEFKRNTGFAPRGTTTSGDRGTVVLFWAGGGSAATPYADQEVKSVEYEGFGDTFTDPVINVSRPWNWVFLNSGSKVYFILGPDPDKTSNTNLSYQLKTTIDLSTLSTSETLLTLDQYSNGADELQTHVTSSYDAGEPVDGRFAVYRTTWKDQTGYILRNDGVGNFFRLKSFYKTEGTTSEPFINIKKLNDMSGVTKTEGQLVPLNSGVFFFNNSGNISAYNGTTGVWETGGPSSSSVAFRTLQDSTVESYNDTSNTLLATSDGDRIAYLSYDYSTSALIKFNSSDLTFSSIGSRPTGEQWIMGVY